MTLSQKLKKLRKEKNITQEMLAKELDVTVSTIRNYEMEKNPRKPTPSSYNKLAQFFKVPIEYLMYDEIENTTKENIDIQKELNLSDEAIENIKDIKDYFFDTIAINYVISSKHLNDIIENLNRLGIIYSLKSNTKELINIITKLEPVKMIEIEGDFYEDLKDDYKFDIDLLNNCENVFKQIDEYMVFTALYEKSRSLEILKILKKIKKEYKKYSFNDEEVLNIFLNLHNLIFDYVSYYNNCIDLYRYRTVKEFESLIDNFLSEKSQELFKCVKEEKEYTDKVIIPNLIKRYKEGENNERKRT